MRRKTMLFLGLAALGALLGLVYATVSTADFAAHLDRQLHPVSCSLLPVGGEAGMLDPSQEGCKVAMFSPYSSTLRDRFWGGIPWSLPAMGLFGFALMLAAWGLITRRGHGIAPAGVLLLAGIAAAVTSAVFFWIAATELDQFCKTCVGTYIGSGLLVVGAALAFASAAGDRRAGLAQPAPAWSTPVATLVLLAEMGLAVAVPVGLYAATLPDYEPHVTACEKLASRDDPKGVLLPLGGTAGGRQAIVVLDPLCPACRAFHRRIEASPDAERLDMKALLLPLDKDCNWMMGDTMHPGACLLSKAMICLGPDARKGLEFAYAHQESFKQTGTSDRPVDRIREALLKEFPGIAKCLDARDTQIRLNDTLNWAVDNALPVLTPQLYLDGRRLCDEDTDLGMEYAMRRLLGR